MTSRRLTHELAVVEPSNLLAESICALLTQRGIDAKIVTTPLRADRLIVNWSSAPARRVALRVKRPFVAYGSPMTAGLARHALDAGAAAVLDVTQGVEDLIRLLEQPKACSSPQLTRQLAAIRRRRSHLTELTTREVQVLDALATNDDQDSVTSELRIAANTLRNHRASIYAKLQVNSLREALSTARQLGIIV